MTAGNHYICTDRHIISHALPPLHTKTNGSNPLTGSNSDPTVQDTAQQHIGACTERRYIAQTKGSSMHEPETDDTDRKMMTQARG